MAKSAMAASMVVSALAGSYQAVQSDRTARAGRRAQGAALQQAQNAAIKQENRAEDELMRARRGAPDLAALLADNQMLKPSATQLSGGFGVTPSTLLGG